MEYIALKDVCGINMGQSPESTSYNENGDFCFARHSFRPLLDYAEKKQEHTDSTYTSACDCGVLHICASLVTHNGLTRHENKLVHQELSLAPGTKPMQRICRNKEHVADCIPNQQGRLPCNTWTKRTISSITHSATIGGHPPIKKQDVRTKAGTPRAGRRPRWLGRGLFWK